MINEIDKSNKGYIGNNFRIKLMQYNYYFYLEKYNSNYFINNLFIFFF